MENDGKEKEGISKEEILAKSREDMLNFAALRY